MRNRSMKDAMWRPWLTRPVSCRDLLRQFQPVPSNSLKALLITMGPFEPATDAYRFDNNGFLITDNQVEQIRQRCRPAIDFVLGASPLQYVRDALDGLSVDIPVVGRVGLPDVVIDAVLGDVRTELVGLLIGLIFDNLPSRLRNYGRCGGMVFSAYDFYLLDWTVDESLGTTSPSTGVLGDYIFSRLLDSFDLNLGTFLEWFTNLHLMPKLSPVADAALGAAVGSLGGPIGAAFGAYLATHAHVFDLGGRKALLKSSKDEWPRIKAALDRNAACAVGLLFGGSTGPWDDHQLMALSYVDNGNGTATLTVWDNRDTPDPRAFQRDLNLDFTGVTGNELKVQPEPLPNRPWGGGDIKGMFLEGYSPRQPPDSLKH